MPEERILAIDVECYAGHRGEQTPRTLILGIRHLGADDVPRVTCERMKIYSSRSL